VLRNQDRWAGLVLHSAAMGVVWTLVLRAQAAIGNILATVVPYAQMVPAVKPEDLHADPAVVRRPWLGRAWSSHERVSMAWATAAGPG
jgi:acylglycerol lipase